MKRYLLLSLLVVTFISCKKKDNNTLPPVIAGSWEKTLEYSVSAMYVPPKPMLLKLGLSTYERYVEGVLVKSGTYRITTDVQQDDKKGYRIIFDNDVFGNKSFYTLKGSELEIFFDPYMSPPRGPGGVQYKRVN